MKKRGFVILLTFLLLVQTSQAGTAVELSSSSGIPGSSLTVSGMVDRGSTGVRILFESGNTTRGLAEGMVAPDGTFSLAVQIPADAALGGSQIGAVKFGSDGSDAAWAPFDVLPPPPGSVAGSVTDKFGMRVGGATVQLLDNVGLVVAQTTADSQGKFMFQGLYPGNYVLALDLAGYLPKDAPLPPGSSMNVDLAPGAVENMPVVVVNGTGAIALPGGSYNSSQPTHVGEPGKSPFAILASIPGKGLPPLNVRFWIDMKHGALSPTTSLRAKFELFNGTSLVATHTANTRNQVFSIAPYNLILAYTADFNSLELPPGNLKLRITGLAGQKNVKVFTVEYPIHLADFAARWYAGNAASPQFNASRKDFYTLQYQFQAGLPPSSVFFNEPIDLGLVALDNKMTLGVPIEEKFVSDGAWSGQASATVELTMLSIPFLNETLPYAGPSGNTLPESTYVLPTVFKDLTGKQCTPIPGLGLDAHKCIKLCFVGCKKCAGIKFGAFFCIQGYVAFDSQIKNDLKLTARASPGIIVSVPLEAVFDIIVCSASAKAEVEANANIPIYYDPDRNPMVGWDDPCLTITPKVSYSFKCFGKTFFKGSKSLGEKTFGCNAAAQGGGGPSAAESAPDDPPELPHPGVAASRGGTAMAVWLPHESELPPGAMAHKPHYSFFDGAQWTGPQPIYPDAEAADETQVVFLDDTRALAVWTHARFIPEGDELTEENEGEFFQSFELRYSIWDGMAWSPPAFLTDDQIYDGRPALAGNPANGSALLVWLRHDTSVMEEEGFLALYYSSYTDGSWSAPRRLDPASRALDFQASARFDHLGRPGVVFVREDDGDVSTPEDRHLMFATSGRVAWSVAQVPNLPIGPWTPSLAFDLANQPVVAFVVPSRSPETDEWLGADGNFSLLMVASRGSMGWQSQVIGETIFAERPVVRVNDDNQAIIMFRRFGFGDGHESGELGAATADMAAPQPLWTTDYLTSDHKLNWQVAFDIAAGRTEQFLFWQKREPNSPPDVPAENIRTEFPRAVDLTFGQAAIIFSNTQPLPGETIRVRTWIKNAGLLTLLDAPFNVSFYDSFPRTGMQPFAEVEIVQPLSFGEELELSADYDVSGGARRTIYVVIDQENRVPEQDDGNNITSLRLTSAPTAIGLVAYSSPGGSSISLEWSVPRGMADANFAIFRAPADDPRALEFVGATRGSAWTDFLPQPAANYVYNVVAMDDGIPGTPAVTMPVSLRQQNLPPEFLAPVLSAALFEDRLVLSWAAQAGLVLQQASNLGGRFVDWQPVNARAIEFGGTAQVTVPAVQNATFFRLVR